MSKRKTPTPPTPANELDELLAGIEGETFADMLADEGISLLEAVEADAIDHDALLESLEAEALAEELEAVGDAVIVIEAKPIEVEPKIVIDRTAIYAEQVSDTSISADDGDLEAPSPTRTKAKKTKVSRSAKSDPDATPRMTVGAAGSRSATLSSKCNLDALTAIGIPEHEIPGLIERMDGLPVKTCSKAENLIRFMTGREHLSAYTKIALQTLADRPVTTPELVKVMMDKGYKIGTARSQSQQMSRLFKAYDMVSVSGAMMSLNHDAPLVRNALLRL